MFYTPTSVNALQFDVVKSFLLQKGLDKNTAHSMALSMIESAKAEGVYVLDTLENTDMSTLDFTNNAYFYLNNLNKSLTKIIGTSENNVNSDSLYNRNIKA